MGRRRGAGGRRGGLLAPVVLTSQAHARRGGDEDVGAVGGELNECAAVEA